MSLAGSLAFVCAECGKGFRRKGDHARHVLIHDPDAERFHCSFPGCAHSSLQKSNLKTHYSSKHLKLRNHRCYFYGCDKSYSDASALIRHEKLTHGFFRRAHKPYARSSVQKVEPELDLELLAFMNAPTSLLSYPHSDVASFASTALPPTPSAFAQSLPGPPSFNWTDNIGRQMQSTDTFLHEMVPDLFLNPKAAANHVGSFPFPDLSNSTNSFAVPATNAGLSYTDSLTSFPQYDIPVPSSSRFMIPGVPQPF